MEKIITEIEQKIKLCSDSTKESRARKGAYVDCLVMLRKANGAKPPLCDVLAELEAINQSEGQTDYYINKFEVLEILSKYFA